ncbi:mucin-7-like [Salvia splendens]|uniref:mucin-7-like n=1 Tax=Salvia splendens TaxID=180675 RepID=UPI001C2538B5|nr:mucin-7-like [Salvia splendens]
MENQPERHKARHKNSQSVKSTAGESSQPPKNLPTKKPPSAPQTGTVATSSSKATTKKPVTGETATTISAVPPTPSTTVPPPGNESDPEEIMREFLKKYGKSEKTSYLFARLAEELRKEEAAPSVAPINIPPRPTTLIETPTSKAFLLQTETPKSPSETLISDITPVIPSTQPKFQFVNSTVVPTSTRERDEREKEKGDVEAEGD